MNDLVDKIKEEFGTLRGKIISAVLAFVVAVLGAVQLGIVDVAEIASQFVGEAADQVEQANE